MLRAWGAQCRRVHDGGVIYPDGAIHVDGWPETSVSAFGERVSRASGAARQHFEEVYRGAGMDVWRVLRASPEIVRSVLIIHYVVRRSAGGEPIGPDGKAEIMGVSRAKYFGLVRSAEWYVAGRLEASEVEIEV